MSDELDTAIHLCGDECWQEVHRLAAKYGNIAATYALLQEILTLTTQMEAGAWMNFVAEATNECINRAGTDLLK